MRDRKHNSPGRHPKSDSSLHAKPHKAGGAAPKGKYPGKSMKRPSAPSKGNVHE